MTESVPHPSCIRTRLTSGLQYDEHQAPSRHQQFQNEGRLDDMKAAHEKKQEEEDYKDKLVKSNYQFSNGPQEEDWNHQKDFDDEKLKEAIKAKEDAEKQIRKYGGEDEQEPQVQQASKETSAQKKVAAARKALKSAQNLITLHEKLYPAPPGSPPPMETPPDRNGADVVESPQINTIDRNSAEYKANMHRFHQIRVPTDDDRGPQLSTGVLWGSLFLMFVSPLWECTSKHRLIHSYQSS